MKAFDNWEKVEASKEIQPLPVGAYIGKVLKAKVATYGQEGNQFEKFEIAFDISEGEYAGFYGADFDNQTGEDKKWKGVLRLYLPKDDGSEQDEWTKRTFKNMTVAFEESNAGYHWDWNEDGLKGKTVGILFRNEEWEFNGRTGWKAQPFRAVSVDSVKKGTVRPAKDKPLANKADNRSGAIPPSNGFAAADDNEDLPF